MSDDKRTKVQIAAAIEEIDPSQRTSDLNKTELLALEASLAPSSFVVAEGKTITSKKGILVEGDKVLPEYFAGGEKSIDSLLKAKCIKKG